jgi:flagellin-like hook-associated protein FlgL
MSNMVVRTNVFALNAHRNLTNVGLSQRTAAQRLSSGFRVNSAADDAAGLAISESMRAQIRGLDQASINSQDAVGLIQTAEGAMSTVSDMVIRIRELMVQAANDTNTLKNREMIQQEIDQIMQEINDVTFRTQFNTRTLLAGGLGGSGGGFANPVSLQWMIFNQARVIGLPHPGGTVGPNGLHPNPNNKNETSLRNSIIELQTELNSLARRVGDRLVASGDFTTTQRDDIFSSIPHDFTLLIPHMTSTENQQMRNIQNRLETSLRNALRAAEEIYQITQDQISALGGMGAINADGSNVFFKQAIEEWQDAAEGARARLDDIRNALVGNVTLTAPQGVLGAVKNSADIETLNGIMLNLVGYSGGTITATGASASIVASATVPITPTSIQLPPPIGAATYSISGTTIEITSDGILDLSTLGDITGFTVQVNSANVLLRQTGGGQLSNVTINCQAGANLFVDGLNIVNTQDRSAISFSGAGNTLNLMGTNTFELSAPTLNTTSAVIEIADGGELEINNAAGHNGVLNASIDSDVSSGAVIGGRSTDVADWDYSNNHSHFVYITISGGTINAEQAKNGWGASGATIGGGFGGGANITINDGVINATSLVTVHYIDGSYHLSASAAVIGSGSNSMCLGWSNNVATVNIHGGTVNVHGNYGIGGAMLGGSAFVTITGGTVNADALSIAIGSSLGTTSVVDISGGTVHAVSSRTIDLTSGSAILAETVNISGGTVDAIRRGTGTGVAIGNIDVAFADTSINISGGNVRVYNEGESAAIGTNFNGANLTISGGVLEILRGYIGGSGTSTNHGTTTYINGNLSPTIAQILSGVVDELGRPLTRVQVPLSPAWGYQSGDQFNRTVVVNVDGVDVSFAVDAVINSNGQLFIWLHGDEFAWVDPPALPDPPDSDGSGLIYDVERLLGLSLGALGIVNLESNAMWFQLGANSMQGMMMQLKGMHTGVLGGGRGDLAMLIDVRERSGIPISEQLSIIDIAEGIVNAQRAQLGAIQNRLEFTRQSLDISSENLTGAESRIRDTDMALEMMRFTQAQVLQQAGISMLAQANQLPAALLQLLQ